MRHLSAVTVNHWVGGSSPSRGAICQTEGIRKSPKNPHNSGFFCVFCMPKPFDIITCTACGRIARFHDAQWAAIEEAKKLLAAAFPRVK